MFGVVRRRRDVLPSTPFVKWLGMRHRVSLQVDQVGMSPVFINFVAQSWREAASIISTRTEDDNWDGRHESLRLLTTPNVKRHPIIRKRSITHLNQPDL